MRALAMLIVALIVTAGTSAAAGRRDFVVDASQPATLRCRPQTPQALNICLILMPKGEHVTQPAMVADAIRWQVVKYPFGRSDERTALYIKPLTGMKDAGISTTIDIMTDGYDMPYRVLVISDPSAPTFSEVEFTHIVARSQMVAATDAAARAAGEHAREMEVIAQHERTRAVAQAQIEQIEDSPCTVERDPHYRISKVDPSSEPIVPSRVFNDGQFTCLSMPATLSSLPIPYEGTARTHWTWRAFDHMLYFLGTPAQFNLKDGDRIVTFEHTR